MDRKDGARGTTFNRWRAAAWTIAALLLLSPLAMMALTDAVAWTVGDFAFAAAMIATTGLLVEAALRAAGPGGSWPGILLFAGTAFALVWANAAVGIVGEEHGDLNLGYPVVVAIAAIVAAAGRFRRPALRRGALTAAAGTTAMAAAAVPLAGPAWWVGAAVFHGLVVAAFAVAAALLARPRGAPAGDGATPG